LGQRVSTINSLYSEQYSYDDFGYLNETVISSGWTATRINDRQGRTLDYQEENGAGKVKNHSVYTHDGDNRILTETTYDDGSTDSGKRIQTPTNAYDAAGNQVESEVDCRFTGINTITPTTVYQYWGVGDYKQTEVDISGA